VKWGWGVFQKKVERNNKESYWKLIAIAGGNGIALVLVLVGVGVCFKKKWKGWTR
jgi:hypothetical protein